MTYYEKYDSDIIFFTEASSNNEREACCLGRQYAFEHIFCKYEKHTCTQRNLGNFTLHLSTNTFSTS